MASESDSSDMSLSTMEISQEDATVALFSGSPDGKPPAPEPSPEPRKVFDSALLDALRRIEQLENERAYVNRAFNDAIVRSIGLETRLHEMTARLAASERERSSFLALVDADIERLEREREAMAHRAGVLRTGLPWKIGEALTALWDLASSKLR